MLMFHEMINYAEIKDSWMKYFFQTDFCSFSQHSFAGE